MIPPTSPNIAPATKNGTAQAKVFAWKTASASFYIVRSNRRHRPVSPNIAPATKQNREFCGKRLERHLHCKRSNGNHHPRSSTNCSCLPRKITLHNIKEIFRRTAENCAEQQDSPCSIAKFCARHKQYHSKIAKIFS